MSYERHMKCSYAAAYAAIHALDTKGRMYGNLTTVPAA